MEIREKEAAEDNLPQVLLNTTQGDVVVELYLNQAPSTVSHFIKLVESGFYDGLTYQRVNAGFMAQGGDPKGNGTGGTGEHSGINGSGLDSSGNYYIFGVHLFFYSHEAKKYF